MTGPRNLEEAKKYLYGDGQFPYNPNWCAAMTFWDDEEIQCSRSAGHGPDKIFCKQHAKLKGE